MAPITVACSLYVYEAETEDASTAVAAATAGGGVIEIRMTLRYQLRIKANGVEELIDDVISPEHCTSFSMPLAFLFPELSTAYVSEILQSLHVDANACEYLSPKIAEFAVDLARSLGPMGNSFGTSVVTVAEVGIMKVDFIVEEEF